jgi:polyketide cyclase/dehydrase/lipid transport protein
MYERGYKTPPPAACRERRCKLRNVAVIACPTDIVAASADALWELLTRPENYDRWTGADLVSVSPLGHAQRGQRIDFRIRALGRTWPVRFEVGTVRDREELELDVFMPLGIVNHELVVLSGLDDAHTRVTFN